MSDRNPALWNGRIAALSDPHLHDTAAGHAFGLTGPACFRSLAETAHSTRVFNESGPALARALELVGDTAICVIAGDMTDDGQAPNWATAARMLRDHSARHGTRFFLTPGNHDLWPGRGLDQTKEMVAEDGSTFHLSSGHGPGRSAPAMRRLSHAEVLAHAAAFGFCRDPRDLLWETPFGTSYALADRLGPISGRGGVEGLLPDLSYLVEPLPGLWLLSLDASVYLPEGDGWRDLSAEGWEAVLRHKVWLLDWMGQVAARARAGGKRLLTFSHYPAVDYLGLGDMGPRAEAGGERRIMPSPATTARIAATGIGLHLSGHWHMSRTSVYTGPEGWLTNIALPSTVAVPAALKTIDFQGDRARIGTLPLGAVPGYDAAFPRYRAEAPGTALADAASLAAFLDRHLAGLLTLRYLPRDWPQGFAGHLDRSSLADLLAQLGMPPPEGSREIAGMQALSDLYRLERAGDLSGVAPARIRLYAGLSVPEDAADPETRALQRLIGGLARQARHPPDADFSADLRSGAVSPAPGRAPSAARPAARQA